MITGLEYLPLALAIIRAVQTGRTEDAAERDRLLAESVARLARTIEESRALDAPRDPPSNP
jgi:hypothetical protein